MDQDVEHFWSTDKVTDSDWPLWEGVSTVMLFGTLLFFLSPFLIGLGLPLLCGISVIFPLWIKILINLSVSLHFL